MELDRLWNWQKKKLACRIRPENGNPAGDSLREMFAELAGVDLNELLNEMKQSKKKKEAADKVAVDHDSEKTFKEVLSRSRILGATKMALEKMEEIDKVKSSSVTQKNLKKVFTVLPKSPPKRVLMDLQRERSKPLRLPDQEEHKLATEKLEKKLAKQRAARMAAIEQSAKNDDGKKIISDFVSTFGKTNVLRNYKGDLFGTGGPYLEGMLYLSRMADSTKMLNIAFDDYDKTKKDAESQLKPEEKNVLDKESSNELFESSDAEGARNPDVNAKLSCAVSLCNWSRNPANSARLAGEGAVRAIMQLSMEPVMKIIIYCVAAFRFMSEQPSLAVAMIEEGAITTISELVSSNTDDFVLYNLAIALVNLTRINGREGQVVDAAIVLALMNLVMIKPELGATCVRGMYNLTCVDVSYPSIERVIRALVSLSLSGASNVKHLCAAALCNLSDLKSVRARMVEEGAINVLTALSRGAETRTRRICAVILQNLSAAKSVRVEMASRNSVAAAYGLSSDQDPIILRCIGLTLSRLSMEPTNCQRIIHEGGIAALCNIAVKYPTIPGITQPVASAFQLLSSNQSYRLQIVNEGSVTAIAALLRSSVDLFTLQHSLLALCNLLCEPENHLSIIQQGLILTLVGMCSNENELLRDFCSLAFLNLSCAEDSRKHLVNGGAVAAIINIAKQESAMTKKRCAATLCNLSYFAAGMSRMVSDGIIPCIVDLVLAKDIITVHYSCAALCRLCSTVENAKLILDSGAVPNLVQGAIDGDHVTKQFCGSVLSSLSFYEYCRIPLCDLGAIGALKGLAELNDDITKQRCLVAFANLSCEISVQLKMVEEGVVGIIAELANSYQEINYICCAKAICNLACFENTKAVVAKEGGVHALMMISMVQSVDRLTKLLCVLGLNNLLDDTTVDFMVTEGLVGSIANMSKIGDSHISNLCSKIFNHLSKYPVARSKMIERTSTLNALYKLCQPPPGYGDSRHSQADGHHGGHRNSSASGSANETQHVAIRTCCNLLLDNSIRETMIKTGVLYTIEKSLEHSQDNETVTQILNTLLSLCTNSSFMESIAKTNIPSILIHLSLINDVSKAEFNRKSSHSLVNTKDNINSGSTPRLQLNVTTNITDKEFEIISKVLAMLSFDNKSRLFLQKKDYFLLIFSLLKSRIQLLSTAKNNNSLSSMVWLVLSLRYLVLDYDNMAELYSIDIKNSLLIIHEALQEKLSRSYNNDVTKLSSQDSLSYFRIYKSLVECVRSLSENVEEIDNIATVPVLALLLKSLEIFQEFKQYFNLYPVSNHNSSQQSIAVTSPTNNNNNNNGNTAASSSSSSLKALANPTSTASPQSSVEEWTKYNVAVVISRFADAGSNTRVNTATAETCSILEMLSFSPKCSELVTVALGMYLFDTKARIAFIVPSTADMLVRLYGYPSVVRESFFVCEKFVFINSFYFFNRKVQNPI
jgi:hypothetical protein